MIYQCYILLPGEMQGLHHSLGQLKNNVGDLKAEWLLIKREVTNIQTDNQELHSDQDYIRQETGKMKVKMKLYLLMFLIIQMEFLKYWI